MNYTLDISSELNEYNRKIKKLAASYSSSYSKADVVDKVKQLVKLDLTENVFQNQLLQYLMNESKFHIQLQV